MYLITVGGPVAVVFWVKFILVRALVVPLSISPHFPVHAFIPKHASFRDIPIVFTGFRVARSGSIMFTGLR
jgi:hypothetical protein